MKLRLLNGAHSALAYLGYLAGHETIADTVADEVFRRYVTALWREEIIPVVPAAAGRGPRRLRRRPAGPLRQPGDPPPHLADRHGRLAEAAAAAARHRSANAWPRACRSLGSRSPSRPGSATSAASTKPAGRSTCATRWPPRSGNASTSRRRRSAPAASRAILGTQAVFGDRPAARRGLRCRRHRCLRAACSRKARAPLPPRHPRLTTHTGDDPWNKAGAGSVPTTSCPCAPSARRVPPAWSPPLHQIPYGEVWSVEAIEERKALIAADPSLGLHWNVVESLPIHERIKLGEGDLAAAVRQLPPVDAQPRRLRGEDHLLQLHAGGGLDAHRAAPHAAGRRPRAALQRAPIRRLRLLHAATRRAPKPTIRRRSSRARAPGSTRRRKSDKATLLSSIMAGLPGAFDRYDIPALRGMLARYKDISADILRQNLARFLREVIPHGRGSRHPHGDPSGRSAAPADGPAAHRLHRRGSRLHHRRGRSASPTASPSAPARSAPARRTTCRRSPRAFADRIHFVHLRNVAKEPDGSFMEADHLGGDTDMVGVVETLLTEQKRRRDAGQATGACPSGPITATNCSTISARAASRATPRSAGSRALPKSAAS